MLGQLTHAQTMYTRPSFSIESGLESRLISRYHHLCYSSNPPCLLRSKFIVYLLPHTVQRESQEEAGPNFFFDQRALDSAHRKQKRQQDGGPPAKRRPPSQPRGLCWFCLGGKEVEKHLVVSIEDHVR